MFKIQFLGLLSVFCFLQLNAQSQQQKHIELKKFDISNISIRAIEVVNDSVVWFAGSNGRYGRITNSTIELDSLSYKGKILNFRSIAFNGKHIFLLSIENPAILFKIEPFLNEINKTKIVYKEEHHNIFYDSMTFFDALNGIAMGDPLDKCLSIILTNDGGNTWQKVNCKNLPDIFEGEAAFAASNSNIAVYKNMVWIVTGGRKARVFFSNNLGIDWTVYDTPIVQGEKMTGIYTVDFYNKKNGIIMGGNWENKSDTHATKAVTQDGGKNWELISNKMIPGYISCVRYVPNSGGKEIIAISTEGIYYSKNKGQTWEMISEEGYFSIRFIDKNTAWLSGNNKIAKMTLRR